MPARHAVLPVQVDSSNPVAVDDSGALTVAEAEPPSEPRRGLPPDSSTLASEGTPADPDLYAGGRGGDAPALVLEERFSIVPEWVLDADISDAAVRLYAVLLRYGQSSGQRMPSRRTLADRLRKKSVDSVDRA